MHRIQVKRNGKIVLPLAYRKKLKLGTGSTVLVGMKDQTIIIRLPKYGRLSLFGILFWLKDKTLKSARAAWADWNE